jgi:hypothetical protein
MVVVMNVAIFWDIAPCSSYVNQCFGGKYHLHLQCWILSEEETNLRQETGHVWCLVPLIFDPEYGGDSFLRNVDWHTDYTALYPRRGQILFKVCFKTRHMYTYEAPCKLESILNRTKQRMNLHHFMLLRDQSSVQYSHCCTMATYSAIRYGTLCFSIQKWKYTFWKW